MLTYQIRKRRYRTDNLDGFSFPNQAQLIFEMMPLQVFGMEAGNGRTVIDSIPSSLSLDLNTGWHTAESSQPLKPLNVIIGEAHAPQVFVSGNVLKVIIWANSFEQLNEVLESIYFGYPVLLSVEVGDPVTITKVYGKVGATSFWWELIDWTFPLTVTTQSLQEQKVTDSWLRFSIISEPTRRRLIAALHYFHVAIRLLRVGTSPWEFMSEAILNFSKVLESLFPPRGDDGSINAARAGLATLGYTEEEVERDFVPAIALRNGIDVGHVHLSVFTRAQLEVLHDYTELAEQKFRELLQRLLKKVQDGTYVVNSYSNLDASSDLVRIIDRIKMGMRKTDRVVDD